MSKRLIFLILTNLLTVYLLSAQDSVKVKRSEILHRFSIEGRPEYVFPTNQFLKGDNGKGHAIDFAASGHLSYAFQYASNSLRGRIYGESYQGLGIGYYSFFDKEELGNPFAFYLFQGSTLAKLGRHASLDFEWNFGISSGWKVYDIINNPFNGGVGSRLNAYLNVDLNVKWNLTPHLDMITGIAFSHFSNGNTRYPNAGVNTGGARIGFAYYINRTEPKPLTFEELTAIPKYPKHVSYDLLLFGAWRRRGIMVSGKEIAAKSVYPVAGFNFAPMYNFCYRFRAGISLDGTYDGSGNVYTSDYIIGETEYDQEYIFHTPSLKNQLALGMSIRAEYVMPYFSINVGIGKNFLYAKGDMRGFYQTLTLKIDLARCAFLNVGYSLHDFQTPNSLMLGIGFRFNNRNPLIK